MKMGSNYIVVTMKQDANQLRCASVSDVDDEWRRGYEEDDGSKEQACGEGLPPPEISTRESTARLLEPSPDRLASSNPQLSLAGPRRRYTFCIQRHLGHSTHNLTSQPASCPPLRSQP